MLSFTIELVQRYVPGRVSDVIDFRLNSLGYLVVAMIGSKIAKKVSLTEALVGLQKRPAN